ncbi:hypothetical protein [Actinomadura madurae]|uniref:hypothetical protein n=1 Tax=Actinomadura madurae TaxID=1993 RepID=UPI0020D20749|nr:hypothetical protein [Actinomadura madurae]MCP9947274.1 hypothetical protein [Actinomadura madurae]MCP9976512.1 hypothetical protein [Actinomadura madurae]MCQ0011992.1 hypothetical protein [Actinomadura madurae]
MARSALTPQPFVTAGLAPTTVTPDAEGVSFRNNGKMILMVTNGSASDITVTPKIAKTIEGVTPTSPARTVAAGATKFLGPFEEDIYRQLSSTAVMFVDFSAVTDVDVALLQHP